MVAQISRRAFLTGAAGVAVISVSATVVTASDYAELDADELAVLKKSPQRFVGELITLDGRLSNFTEAPTGGTFDLPDAEGSYRSFCELRTLIPTESGREWLIALVVAESRDGLQHFEDLGSATLHGEVVGLFEDDNELVYPVVAMHELFASTNGDGDSNRLPEPTPEPEPTRRPRPTKEPASTPVPLGEVAEWDGWQVRVLNAYPEERPDLPGLAYSITLTLGVTNAGEDLRNFGLPDMDLWIVSEQGWKGTYSLIESARLTVGLGEWGSALTAGVEYQQSSVYWVNAFDWNRFPDGLDNWTLHIVDGRDEPVLDLGF